MASGRGTHLLHSVRTRVCVDLDGATGIIVARHAVDGNCVFRNSATGSRGAQVPKDLPQHCVQQISAGLVVLLSCC